MSSANIFFIDFILFYWLKFFFLLFKVPWYYYYTLALPCTFCKGCWAGNCDLLTVCQLHSDFRLHLLLCWPLNVFALERLMRVSLKQQWHLKFSSFFSFEKTLMIVCLLKCVCLYESWTCLIATVSPLTPKLLFAVIISWKTDLILNLTGGCPSVCSVHYSFVTGLQIKINIDYCGLIWLYFE